MSRSRSASLEIVPPTSRIRETAAHPEPASKVPRKHADDDAAADADADAEAEDTEEQAPAPPATKPAAAASAANVPNAPKPCERCARTGKPCKGVAGSRCEYCKRLKQKCSNSTGPPRGKTTKPTPTKKAPDVAVNVKGPTGKPAVPSQLPSQPPNTHKRKAPVNAGAAPNGNVENHSLDGDGSTVEEDHDHAARQNKKRRVAKGNAGPTRAQLVKAVNDIEASIKRVQASVAKEVEKMSGVMKALNAKIDEMDDE